MTRALIRPCLAIAAVIAVSLAGVTARGSQKYDERGPYSRVLSQGPYKALSFKRVFLRSKVDNVPIEVGYWRPNVPSGTHVPVIAVASPYFTGINPTDASDMSSKPDDVGPEIENYVSHGYAVAGVSIRGSGYSGGCIEMFGAKEVADIGTAMDYLGTQPWSNGKIGVMGLSYDGAGAWEAAASGSRYVKAVIPAEGFVDARDVWYRYGRTGLGGVSQAAFLAWPARHINAGYGVAGALDRVTGTVCPELAETAASYIVGQTVGGIDPIGYWNERNHKPAIESHYRGAILLTEGTKDDDPLAHQVIPWVQTLARRGVDVRQWIGPWNHSFPDGVFYDYHRWDWAEYVLHYMDHELKGDNSYDLGPRVQVMDNTKTWRYEDEFPPKDAGSVTYAADGDGTLRSRATKSGSYQLVPLLSEWPYKHNSLGDDPVEQAARKAGQDGAVFDLPVTSSAGLRFSGVPRMHVTVTPEGTTGAISAYLYDVAPSGTETELTWATLALEYRWGDYQPHPVMPGSHVNVSMDFEPTDAFVAKGHHLRVRLWQLDPETSFDLRTGPMIVRVGPSTTTAVTLPVITRTKPRTFVPPQTFGP